MKLLKSTSINTTTFLLFVFFFATNFMFGQTTELSVKKYITVTGSAEMSIEPDELELSITLYSQRQDLDKKETDFYAILKKHDISQNQLTFNQSDSWWDWWYYRNSSEISKTFKLKVDAKTNLLNLVKDLNKNWVHSISITSSTNKNIQTYRKEVKKEAIRAAKEKATYLLDAVEEKIGSAITVEEISDNNNSNYNSWYANNLLSNSISNSNISVNSYDNNGSDKIENVSKIKLRYEVKVIFEIR
jgi:uncharacterized protein